MLTDRDNEERRLLADFEACRKKQFAVNRELSNPTHGMLYPEYKRLLDKKKALRVESGEKLAALRAYRGKIREAL